MTCNVYLRCVVCELAGAAVMKTDHHLEVTTVGELPWALRDPPWGAAARLSVFAHLS